jgi:hypothetical protein
MLKIDDSIRITLSDLYSTVIDLFLPLEDDSNRAKPMELASLHMKTLSLRFSTEGWLFTTKADALKRFSSRHGILVENALHLHTPTPRPLMLKTSASSRFKLVKDLLKQIAKAIAFQ